MSLKPLPDPAARGHRVPVRPNPTRLRYALGIGGLAAMSGLVTGIVLPPSPATSSASSAPEGAIVTSSPGTVAQHRPIKYVQLSPGEAPPPGAKVIDAKAPKPITIVTLVPAPQRTVVVRTTQSGKVLR